MNPDPSTDPAWPEALATVLECKYNAGAGRALAFGIPVSKHFVIRYNYFANGELHEGTFASARPIPQGQLFPIRYDPSAPQKHTHALSAAPGTRPAILALGVFLSFFLALLCFILLKSCQGRGGS